MTKRILGVSLAVVIASGIAAGQGLAGSFPVPAFEVASVRPAAVMDQQAILAVLRSGRRPESMSIDGLRATFKYMSLKELVADSYKVRAFQVSGPQWMTTDRFDIVAKMPEGGSRDDVPAMLKGLLQERFKLAAHLETKDHPVLGLMLEKGGSKMKETPALGPINMDAELEPGQTKVDTIDGPMILTHNKDGSTTYNMGSRGKMTMVVDGQNGTLTMDGNGTTMPGLAMMLTMLGGGNGRQVVDLTGLTGHYDVSVTFGLQELTASLRESGTDIPTRPGGDNGGAASDPGGNSTVADALGKLGLKMAGTHAMVEQLVVDHVEKLPTDN